VEGKGPGGTINGGLFLSDVIVVAGDHIDLKSREHSVGYFFVKSSLRLAAMLMSIY